jgi:ParB family chromosome partitioning protein
MVMELNEKAKRKYQNIFIELIKSPMKPSREIFEDINALAATIQEHGLLQPVLVKKLDAAQGFEVVVGERRLRACRKAGLTTVPCIVLDGVSEEQILQMQLIENLQRSDLKPFEEIRIVEALKNRHDLTNDEIAVKTGLSSSTVQNYLTLAKGLSEEYLKMINNGSHSLKDLTITKALLLARANLPADQLKEKVNLIRQRGLSRAHLSKKLAKSEKRKIKRVAEGRKFWRELTRTLKDFARYWSDYSKLEEWESVDAYHLNLKVTMLKDLSEPGFSEVDGLETLSADEAPQVCASCGEEILAGDRFKEKDGVYFCSECADETEEAIRQ